MSELTKSKYELASFCNEMEWLQQIALVLRLKEELLFTNKSIDFLVLGTLQQAPQHQRVISDGYSTRRSLVSTCCKNNVSKSGRNCWKVDLHETKGASSVQNATRTAKTVLLILQTLLNWMAWPQPEQILFSFSPSHDLSFVLRFWLSSAADKDNSFHEKNSHSIDLRWCQITWTWFNKRAFQGTFYLRWVWQDL